MTIQRSGRFADSVVGGWLDGLLATYNHTLYAGLFTIDPASVSDPRTAEAAGIGYTRAESGFHRSGRLLVGDDPMLWSLPAGSHIIATGLWSAPTNGLLLCSGACPVVDLPTGGSILIQPGTYFAGIDA